MRCTACGRNAPTQYVEFYQNIGVFVMRFYKEVKGNLCKKCINHYFLKFTLTTATVGWFGMISMILTPIFIVNNLIRYCGALGLKSGDPIERPPTEHPTLSLTPDAFQRLERFRGELQDRLHYGENPERLAAEIGPRAGTSAIQVEKYIEEELDVP